MVIGSQVEKERADGMVNGVENGNCEGKEVLAGLALTLI